MEEERAELEVVVQDPLTFNTGRPSFGADEAANPSVQSSTGGQRRAGHNKES